MKIVTVMLCSMHVASPVQSSPVVQSTDCTRPYHYTVFLFIVWHTCATLVLITMAMGVNINNDIKVQRGKKQVLQ